MLAGWTEDGWRFVAPIDGMIVWVEADGVAWRYVGDTWQVGDLAGRRVSIGGVQVIGSRGDAIGDPTGGSVIDDEARAAIVAILAALRSHGLIAS